MTKLGINGFGRIGRMAFRAALERTDVEVVAVNDLLDVRQLAHLLKYDSVHGRLRHTVEVKDNFLVVDGRPIRTTAAKDPASLGWGDVGADVVIESTGAFLTREKSEAHLRGGAKRVIMSAPAKDETPMFVFGVNSANYAGEAIISAASCTTNCLAPIAKVLDESFGIKRGLMTTIHATTASQKTVDGTSGKDWRFGRSILENIIPATTGAAKAVTKVLTSLKGRFDRHGVPGPGVRRVRGGPDLRAGARGELRRHLYGDEDGLRWCAQRRARLHRRRRGLDRLPRRELHVGVRREGGDATRPDVREAGRVVRQRVGLLVQAGGLGKGGRG